MKPRKLIVSAAVAALAVMSLSGCIREEITVNVNSNAEITKLVILFGLDKQAASQGTGEASSSVTDLDSFKKSFGEQNAGDGGPFSGEEANKYCAFSETDKEFIAECTIDASDPKFKDTMGEASSGQGMPVFAKDGNNIKMTVETKASGSDLQQAAALGVTMKEHIIFPGEVKEVNGAGAAINESNKNQVTIDILKTDGSTITATASDGSSSGGFIGFLIAGLAVLVLVAGGVALAFTMKGKGKADTEDMAPLDAPSPESTSTDPLMEDMPDSTNETDMSAEDYSSDSGSDD